MPTNFIDGTKQPSMVNQAEGTREHVFTACSSKNNVFCIILIDVYIFGNFIHNEKMVVDEMPETTYFCPHSLIRLLLEKSIENRRHGKGHNHSISLDCCNIQYKPLAPWVYVP